MGCCPQYYHRIPALNLKTATKPQGSFLSGKEGAKYGRDIKVLFFCISLWVDDSGHPEGCLRVTALSALSMGFSCFQNLRYCKCLKNLKGSNILTSFHFVLKFQFS